MRKNIFYALIVSLCVLSLAFIYGCGSNPAGGGGGSAGGRVYYGIISRGDTIKFTMKDKSFNFSLVDGPDVPLTVSGTVTTLESGLLSAEVTSSTNTGAVAIGDVFYGIELTGEVLAFGGGGGSSGDPAMLLCPALTSTRPLAGTYEAIMIAGSTWETIGSLGCATLEVFMTSSISFEVVMFTLDGFMATSDYPTGYSYTDHLFKARDKMEIFNSPKGLFVGNLGGGKDGGFAGALHDTSIAIAGIAAGGSQQYKGMAYKIEMPTVNNDITIMPIIATTDASLIYVSTMDAVSGATVEAIATLSLGNINIIAAGIIDGTIEVSGDTGPMQMAAYKYNDLGKYILTGIATADDAVINFFMIEQ